MSSSQTTQAMPSQLYVLVLYYSLHGSVKALAREIALGVESQNMEAKLRRVVSAHTQSEDNNDDQTPVCTTDELEQAGALALGGPARFGNIAAPIKLFLEENAGLWMRKSLLDKPACVFTSSASIHGGQEAALLNMMIPLFHHGMIVMGLEYDQLLSNSTSGCSPYGVSHWAHKDSNVLTAEEKKMCHNMGRRLAKVTVRLRS